MIFVERWGKMTTLAATRIDADAIARAAIHIAR